MVTGVSEAERDLIERAQGGDNRAFGELVRRYQRAVYGMARRETGNHADADEVAQATFVKAHAALGGFRGSGSLKSWLLRICVNLIRNRRRSQKRMTSLEPGALDLLMDESQATQTSMGDEIDAARRRAQLREAVSGLPEKQRLTVELRIYQGLAFAEVADVLGGTENAAKVNFHHAVKALKTAIRGREEAA